MLPDEAATQAVGALLAVHLKAGDLVRLRGDLGAGKTTLVRGCLRALGITGRVRSPSFALMESYECPGFELCHFDFYRLSSPMQWRDAGFDERIGADDAVCLIEWPEQAGSHLPQRGLVLELAWSEQEHALGRRLLLSALDARGAELMHAMTASPA
jgi:tRNA threonylcarbamoyladenosine biosynthesis protein TsaE